MGKPAVKAKMPMWAAGNRQTPTLPRFARSAAPRRGMSLGCADALGATALRRLGGGQLYGGGFTLIELMVVITLIAIATAGVSFAIRDNESTLLDREADRLSVILETARVQSRSSGVALAWLPLAQGFVVLPASELKTSPLEIEAGRISLWLSSDMNVQIVSKSVAVRSMLLGAEPMIAPSSVVLSLGARRVLVATDGLRPFAVQSIDQAGKP